MKVAITGGFGFLGKHIIKALQDEGHSVTVFARRDESAAYSVGFVRADLMIKGVWQEELAGFDAVVNLAGVNIFQRWNKDKKKEIYDSRIISTANVVDAITSAKAKVKVFVNSSAVGYYGFHGDEKITESEKPGSDFLANVCSAWEDAALKAAGKNIRTVILRFGSVFGHDGGAFPLLKKTYRMMAGAKLGNGRQWFPWLHVDDAAGIVLHSLKEKKMNGPYNCTAPDGVTNAAFTKKMAASVHRPVLAPFVPAFMLRIVLGEFGFFLTKGQNAVPDKLLVAGYSFKYPELEKALLELLSH